MLSVDALSLHKLCSLGRIRWRMNSCYAACYIAHIHQRDHFQVTKTQRASVLLKQAGFDWSTTASEIVIHMTRLDCFAVDKSRLADFDGGCSRLMLKRWRVQSSDNDMV
jgi:hypothetical protein